MKDFRSFLGKIVPNLYIQHGSHSKSEEKETRFIPNLYIQHGSHSKPAIPAVYIQQGFHSLKKIFKKTDIKENDEYSSMMKDHENLHTPESKAKKYKKSYKDSYYHYDVSKETIEKTVNNPNSKQYHLGNVTNSSNLTSDHITKILNHPNADSYTKINAIKNPNASSENISHYMDKYKNETDYHDSITQHPSLTSDHITKILNHPEYNKQNSWGYTKKLDSFSSSNIINHPSFKPEHIKKFLDVSDSHMSDELLDKHYSDDLKNHIIKHGSNGAKMSLINHPNSQFTEDEFNTLKANDEVKRDLYSSKHMTPEKIHSVLDNEHEYNFHNRVLRGSNVDGSHHLKVLDNPEKYDRATKKISLNSQYVTPEHVNHFMNHGDDDSKQTLLGSYYGSKHITSDHISNILNNSNEHSTLTNLLALEHDSAKPEHYKAAFESGNEKLQQAALKKPQHLGPDYADHIFKNLDNFSDDTVKKVVSDPNIKPEHIIKALDSEKWAAHYNLLNFNHANITDEHINHVMNKPKDKGESIKNMMINNEHIMPKIKSEHITKFLENGNNAVANVLYHPSFGPEHVEHVIKKGDVNDISSLIKSDVPIPKHLNDELKNHPSKTIQKSIENRNFWSHDNTHLGKTISDVNDHLYDHQNYKALNQEERQTIRHYTGGSSSLNNYLINHGEHHENPEHENHDPDGAQRHTEKIKNLDSAMKKLSLPKMTTYSGVSFDPREKAKDGVFKSTAYLSTSTNPKTARSFAPNLDGNESTDFKSVKHILRFHVPKGNSGIFVGNSMDYEKHDSRGSEEETAAGLTSHDEHEIIMPRNVHYKIDTTPTKVYKGDSSVVHMYDAHPIPHHIEDKHAWEPPSTDKEETK